MSKLKSSLRKIKKLLYWMNPLRLFRALCMGVGFLTLSVLSLSGLYLYSFLSSLPEIHTMSFETLQEKAKKRTLEKFETPPRKKPRWIPIREVNRDFLYAVVMSEDSGYFEHSGVNYGAITEAILKNLRKKKYAFGASTISQQVVKNVFLSQEKTITRKIKEILITQDLEERFSKNEILEIYLNIAEFGPDIYGVNSASRYYFEKFPIEVNAAEGAFLALMLPSPRKNHYAIFENQNLTPNRRKKIKRVLRDMLYKELISDQQFIDYLNYNFFSSRTSARDRHFRNRKLAGKKSQKKRTR